MNELIKSAYYLVKMQELAQQGLDNMSELKRVMESNDIYTAEDFEKVNDEIYSANRQVNQYKESISKVIKQLEL